MMKKSTKMTKIHSNFDGSLAYIPLSIYIPRTINVFELGGFKFMSSPYIVLGATFIVLEMND